MNTYVVIPHFLVTDELVSLADNTISTFREYSDATIISVDDSGEYDSAEGADKVLDKSDVLLTNDINCGFAKTCNNGLRWIFENEDEDCYIICANNDIEINSKTIPALKYPFETLANIAISGIISTKEHTIEGKPIEEADWYVMSSGGLLGDRMQDGGLWMSTKSILQKIGIFDERFIRGGYEDIDLFLRARDTFGMNIIMNGRAFYWHKQGATRWNTEKIGSVNDFGFESRKIEDENLERFIEKWGFNPQATQIWKENIIR